MMPSYDDKLPPILWFWIPLGTILFQLIGERFIYQDYMAWVVGENGPYELVQFIVITLALILAVRILVGMDRSDKYMTTWIALAAVCCFYVSGEEISWAQHFAKWNTPEYWASFNDQNETNLHNTSSWLDQKPRLLLSIGVYVGGIIIPLLLKYKPSFVPSSLAQIYPTRAFIVTASICVLIRSLDIYGDMTNVHVFGRSAENEELFLFYFVFLYLLLMKKRLIPAKKQG